MMMTRLGLHRWRRAGEKRERRRTEKEMRVTVVGLVKIILVKGDGACVGCRFVHDGH